MSLPFIFTETANWRRAAVLALVTLAGIILAGDAQAQSLWERLVMPGDLTQPHAKLETKCDNCHISFSQGAQAELCLDCHKETAADFRDRRGFHGRSPEANAFDCNHCHTDHEGRDFSIADIDRETFDHTLTDFTLAGAHTATDCRGCHEAGKPFRMAPGACFDCHREEEPHNGALGKDCASCHAETGWTDIKPFDHSKTEFALKGLHSDLACQSCHRGEIYKSLPKDCQGCHAIHDVHTGRFGAKCESCHSENGWTKVRFDHDRDTDFSLTGRHRETRCNACHTINATPSTPGAKCADCHGADDVHKGALGAQCASCHKTDGWRSDVAFDHDISAFPLIGQHVLVACEQCHFDRTFHSIQTDCAACHRADDKHKGGLGPDCAGCHTPNGWAFWSFDHDRQTDFRLTGQHAGLICSACHSPETDPAKTGSRCIACHERDDVHRGGFGPDCAACHTTDRFKGARLKR